MSAIEVKNLVKKFHGQTVLHGIDLEVKPGEVVAIIGPSGSGKTTLLRSINLLEQPEAGTITVGDITIDTARSLSQQKSLIRQLRQHVGFVFQNFNLFPHRTVLENIIEGPVIVKGEPKEEATARARELLAKVGLAGKETSYPRRLSGGQQQRVAIARALAMHPEVILFDEPTSEGWRSAFTKVNQFIRRQPYYIDLEPHFIDSKGVMQNRLAIDGLHPGLEGKELMAQIIERNWVRVTR